MIALDFGDAGVFIWPAYALAALTFAALALTTRARLKRWSALARERGDPPDAA